MRSIYIPVFMLFLLSAVNSIGQKVLEGTDMPKNHYSSIWWLQDRLGAESIVLNGVRLRIPRIIDGSLRLDISEGDSSTVSRVLYANGANANQHFFASLYRPISEKIVFNFDLRRYSYAGWMDRGFYRSTEISSSIEAMPIRDLRLSVAVDFMNEDREINGGLMRSQYSTDESVGGAFQSVYTDIWLNDAFNRANNLNFSSEGNYKCFDISGFSVYVFGGADYFRERLQYQDEGASDRAFYEDYSSAEIEVIDDSSALNTFKEHVGTQFLKQDSSMLMDIGSEISFLQHSVLNNGNEFKAVNTVARTWLHAQRGVFVFHFNSKNYIGGYNNGDNEYRAEGGIERMWDRDSVSQGKWNLLIGVNRIRAYPRLQYFNYRSTIMDVRNLRVQSEQTSLNVTASVEAGGFYLAFVPGIRSIDRYQYWDSTATVNLLEDRLQMLSLKFETSWSTDYFEIGVRQWVQQSSNDEAYSMPQFVSQGRVFTSFPLFKKRLQIKTGLKGEYFSEYNARGYLPHLDSYYSQSENQFGNYLQLDYQASLQIKNTRVFFELHNLNYQLFMSPVLVGPNYPSVPRYTVFGIDWVFKN